MKWNCFLIVASLYASHYVNAAPMDDDKSMPTSPPVGTDFVIYENNKNDDIYIVDNGNCTFLKKIADGPIFETHNCTLRTDTSAVMNTFSSNTMHTISWFGDAVKWFENAADDTVNWTKKAAEDTVDWTKNAANDVADWTKNAAKFVYYRCLNGEVLRTAAAGAASGGTVGGTAGSIVPVVGTAVGAVGGAFYGALGSAAAHCATLNIKQ